MESVRLSELIWISLVRVCSVPFCLSFNVRTLLLTFYVAVTLLGRRWSVFPSFEFGQNFVAVQYIKGFRSFFLSKICIFVSREGVKVLNEMMGEGKELGRI